MSSKYQKIKGYWVYAHITPEKDVYIGMSKRQPNKRWIPSRYIETALEPYIERFGWENIEHRVLIDGLTKQQAEQVEDWFITQITEEGFCINKYRSGGHKRDNDEVYREQQKKFHKAYREIHKDEIREQIKAWYEAHREERLEYMKAWYKSHREEMKAYDKQRLSSPEGKIYSRVANYNRKHPDLAIETPLEAKKKYLDWGYIPNYIKRDDLI